LAGTCTPCDLSRSVAFCRKHVLVSTGHRFEANSKRRGITADLQPHSPLNEPKCGSSQLTLAVRGKRSTDRSLKSLPCKRIFALLASHWLHAIAYYYWLLVIQPQNRSADAHLSCMMRAIFHSPAIFVMASPVVCLTLVDCLMSRHSELQV
jgi:hypothetical protein